MAAIGCPVRQLPSLASIDHRNPFLTYEELQEHDPVHWSEHLRAWVVTRFDDVRDGLRSAAMSVRRDDVHFGCFTAADQARFMPLRQFYRSWLMFLDPPRHTLLRRLVTEALRQSFTHTVRDRIAADAEAAVTEFANDPARSGDVVSLSKKIARGAIAALFDISDRDAENLESLSAPIVAYLDGRQRDTAKAERAQESMFDLITHLLPALFERARRRDGHDLISALVRQPMGRGLVTDVELAAVCTNLLVDSHEPIVSSIASGMAMLIEHEAARFGPEPDDLSDEVIRLTTPFQYCARRTLRPVVIGTKIIPADQRVMLMTCAANRDIRRFPNPSRISAGGAASRHLAFGHGRHYCVGAALAKHTVGAAVKAMLKAIPQPTIDPSGVAWRQSVGFRAPLSLHIGW